MSRPKDAIPKLSRGESVEVAQKDGESASGEALPEGWAWTDLKTVCRKITDGTHHSPPKEAQNADGEFKYITAKNIKEHGIIFRHLTYLSEEIHRPIYERCNPEKGDVLYIKDGVTTGVATVNELEEEFSMLSSVALLKPYSEAVSPYFLKWYLNSPVGFRAMTSQMGGTAIKRLTLKKINAGAFPLAPKAEQSRIVSAIESLQERSSRARVLLSEVGPLIGQLRQSVLRDAFSGKLTADWRARRRMGTPESPSPPAPSEENSGLGAQATNPAQETASELLLRIRTERRERWQSEQLAKYEAKGKQPPKNWQDKYKELEPVDESELPELPEGWCWAAAEEIVEPGIDIVYGIVQPGPNLQEGVPYVRGLDIQNGTILVDQLWNTSEKIAERYVRSALEGGDVLLGIIRHTKVAVVPDEISGGNMGRATARFRPSSVIHSKFLAGALESPDIQRWMLSQSRGIDMPIINVGDVRRTPIPLAPLEEQNRILEVLDEALEMVDSVMAVQASMESSLTQLDQSILSKAFRGELVPQDPRDEPASELLARIRAQRGTFKTQKENQKRKAAKS